MTGEPRGLGPRRTLARLILWWERLLPAVLPAAGVAGVFLALALLDVPKMLPWWGHAALLAVTGLAIAGLLWHGLSRLIRPSRDAADRRLERDSGLTHRPLAVLDDPPAIADPASLGLWRAHVARSLAKAGQLRLGWPHPGVAARDPRAMRYALLLGLAVLLVIAGKDAPGRLTAAFEPGLPHPTPAAAADVQAWATPPAYTGLAPIFLKRDPKPVALPAGSRLTVNVTGGEDVPDLWLGGSAVPFATLDHGSFQIDRPVAGDGAVTVRQGGRDLAHWDLTVTPDQPPTAYWAAPPGPSESGARTRLPWRVTDDYGVAETWAELRLTARPEAPPLTVPIPLPGGAPRSAHGLTQPDLTAHPWAGLAVSGRLTARDGAGQTGVSAAAAFDLPERAFRNEIARALIAMRKGLSLHPDDRADALEGLDGLLQKPETFGADSGAFLNLSTIYYLLVRNKIPEAVPEAQDRMWVLALHLEEGQTEETARALDAARQAAKDAMELAAREPSDANQRALEQRLTELREAIDRHMRAMMEEAMRQQQALPFDPEAEHLSAQDLDRMTEEAKEASRQGRMDEARQKMEALEKLLDRLKEARAEKGQGNSQQRQRGQRQMGAAQDLVAREAGLLDHSENRAERSAQPRGVLPRPEDGNPGAERDTDRRVQQALRHALGELMQQFGDLTGEIPGSLTEADQAMREAGTRLGAGDDRAAGAQERKAIEALQKGARDMGRALARQFGRGQSSGEQGEGDGFGAEGPMGMMMQDGRGDRQGGGPLPGAQNPADARRRDPLGRTNPGSGLDSGDVRVPAEAERQRTQAIQEELRRKGAERERPRRELDYFDRLLRAF